MARVLTGQREGEWLIKAVIRKDWARAAALEGWFNVSAAEDGLTPLIACARLPGDPEALAFARRLLDLGASLWATDSRGDDALKAASSWGAAALSEMLIEEAFARGEMDSSRATVALRRLARFSDSESRRRLLMALLSAGADPDQHAQMGGSSARQRYEMKEEPDRSALLGTLRAAEEQIALDLSSRSALSAPKRSL